MLFRSGAASRAARLALTLVLAAGALPVSGLAQLAPAQPAGLLKTFFTTRSAKSDTALGEEVRKLFEDDDGSPLKSVPYDLDGDGNDEKFVLSGAPAASGGPQWLVWDPETRIGRGLVIGAVIFIERATDDAFPRLETYWKQGGTMGVVFNYAFVRGRYVREKSRSLTVPEINEYFGTKPPLDLDKELVEIKDEK